MLVTSNAHAWRGVAEPVEIRLWPKQIGADYLIARTGRETEREAALALSEALGGLPLAHEQAAARADSSVCLFSAGESSLVTSAQNHEASGSILQARSLRGARE